MKVEISNDSPYLFESTEHGSYAGSDDIAYYRCQSEASYRRSNPVVSSQVSAALESAQSWIRAREDEIQAGLRAGERTMYTQGEYDAHIARGRQIVASLELTAGGVDRFYLQLAQERIASIFTQMRLVKAFTRRSVE